VFSNNRDRLLEGEVAQEFLALIVEQAPAIPLASHAAVHNQAQCHEINKKFCIRPIAIIYQ
jgi:hypothetical protein